MSSQEGAKEPSSPAPTHRLPTVSASQALKNINVLRSRSISTGLPQLDQLLQGQKHGSDNVKTSNGGLIRGQVTEISGPPGVGKTCIAMSACANALRNGDKVVWIDGSYHFARPRLESILENTLHSSSLSDSNSPTQPSTATVAGVIRNLYHYQVPTLAHLLALTVHAPQSFPPDGTSLIVIDSLSTLFDAAYVRLSSRFDSGTPDPKTREARRWASNRRFAVLGSLVSSLGKLATVKSVAVLVITEMMTRVRPGGGGTGAILIPALSYNEWDSGVANRVILFRDWLPTAQNRGSQIQKDSTEHVRFAGVVKVGGTVLADRNENREDLKNIVPFTIEETGIVPFTSAHMPPLSSPIKALSPGPRKRTFDEIADSEEESEDDYGWPEEDDVAAEGLIDYGAPA
ncbi:MAG: hypothetical protein M1820_010475 [Bogoriella megaspora]|nr:MAG: hypothetical protein M1820_010475 [Bogoriella megaspora]